MNQLRSFVVLWICLVLLGGCSSSPLWEVSVLNMTDKDILIRDGRSRSTAIKPGRGYEKWTLKMDRVLKIESDGQTIEEYTAAQLGLPQHEDGRALLIVGGPSELLLADYSEFYTAEGQEPMANPKIKLVHNLRTKSIAAIKRSDVLSWPGQALVKTQYDGGGFKEHRYLRLVQITQEMSDEKIQDFLDLEFQERLKKL